MLGNRLPGHIKVLSNGIGSHSLKCYQHNNPPSCRICNGLKYVSSHLSSIFKYESGQLQIYVQPIGFPNIFCKLSGTTRPPLHKGRLLIWGININTTPAKMIAAAANNKKGAAGRLFPKTAHMDCINNTNSFSNTPATKIPQPFFHTADPVLNNFSIIKNPTKKKLRNPRIIRSKKQTTDD